MKGLKFVILVLGLLALFTIPTSAQAHSVTLSWTPSTTDALCSPACPVTSVTIYRSLSSGTETVLINVPVGSLPACPSGTPVGSQCFIDTAVSGGNTYFYQVSSTNINGVSAKSLEVSALIPNNVPPAAPTNLKATAQ